MPDPTTPGLRRLMVFAHPSHELGMYGLAQQVAPDFLFLTDGNHERRLFESRAALGAIGLEERARYLLYPESSIYERMLAGDVDFFHGIVDKVREVVEEVDPEQVFCDAVEFYNPSHDISLPITRAALAGRPGVEVFEVPLIFQTRAEQYVMQRVVPSRREEAFAIELTPEQTAAKRQARDGIFDVLRADLGTTLTRISDEELSLEEVRPADDGLRGLPEECLLRYENRGRLLEERGEVERALTYEDHYRPIAAALFERAAA